MVKQNSNPNAAGDASRLHELLGNDVTVIQWRTVKSTFFFLSSKSNEEYKREVPITYTATEVNVCGFISSACQNYYSLISF